MVAFDRHCLDLADLEAGDPDLVALVEATGVFELPVVVRLGEQHRNTGEALADPDDQQGHQDAHQTDVEPIWGSSVLIAVRTYPWAERRAGPFAPDRRVAIR